MQEILKYQGSTFNTRYDRTVLDRDEFNKAKASDNTKQKRKTMFRKYSAMDVIDVNIYDRNDVDNMNVINYGYVDNMDTDSIVMIGAIMIGLMVLIMIIGFICGLIFGYLLEKKAKCKLSQRNDESDTIVCVE